MNSIKRLNKDSGVDHEPVAEFVDLVLGRAVREGASDVHFEPEEAGFRIRSRVDGELLDGPVPPRELANAVTTRLKVMAGLDIAERRLPQDGRIRWAGGGRPVDMRISTLPTEFGESIVVRVLDPERTPRNLAALGMPAWVESGIRRVIARPDGMLIATGPTGSGKTTTLYGALRELNRTELKLLTIEDPVEYEVEGVIQVSLNPKAGLTFATALRSFLRQDPDVILVGEIRDAETARVAVQASLTGHLVLATLHTTDAAGAVVRLIDLGIERYLVAAALRGILAQRLLRRAPTAGMPGRLGVFEWLPIDARLRELIHEGASLQAVRSDAVGRLEIRTLRTEADAAAGRGEVTAEVVEREIG